MLLFPFWTLGCFHLEGAVRSTAINISCNVSIFHIVSLRRPVRQKLLGQTYGWFLSVEALTGSFPNVWSSSHLSLGFSRSTSGSWHHNFSQIVSSPHSFLALLGRPVFRMLVVLAFAMDRELIDPNDGTQRHCSHFPAALLPLAWLTA